MDISHFDVAREIGDAFMSESDAKLSEAMFEFINSAWREHEEELFYDAASGEVMVKELAEAARRSRQRRPRSTECTRRCRSRSVGRVPVRPQQGAGGLI